MKTIKRFVAMMLCISLCMSVTQAQPAPDKRQNAQTPNTNAQDVLIIIQQEQVRFTARKAVEEMRLQVFDQAGQLVYDSGPSTGSELTWILRQANGEAVKSGLYAYTLSIKEIGREAGAETTRRGHFIVDRARERDGKTDRLWITSQNEGGVGTALTAAMNEDATIAGTSITSERDGAKTEDETARNGEGESKSESGTAVRGLTSGTEGRIAKFTSSTNLGSSVMTESNGKIGIGASNPLATLHIISSDQAPPRAQSVGDGNFAAGWDFYHGTVGKGYVGVPGTGVNLAPGEMLLYGAPGTKTSLWAGGNRSVTLETDGDVLIGTDFSLARLTVESSYGPAIWGRNDKSAGVGGYSRDSYGVYGSTHNGRGVYGQVHSGTGYAGYFDGKVHINGNLSKSSGSFKIDHPLDPENKYLSHSFVESPDMMNIYNGNVTTDAKGLAVVTLPDYFTALNRDYRYQLTVIGQFSRAIVLRKIKDNRFAIKTDKPRVEVSWQVTGIRQDAYARANRIQVEEEKTGQERGAYLNPEAFGQPQEKGVGRASHQAATRQAEEEIGKVGAGAKRTDQ